MMSMIQRRHLLCLALVPSLSAGCSTEAPKSADSQLPPMDSSTGSEPAATGTGSADENPDSQGDANDSADSPTTGESPSTDESGGDASFVTPSDAAGTFAECNIWDQDCPKGEKCRPFALDGGSSWNATKCSPVVENPSQAGDPCTMIGGAVSGDDDCDAGSICWGVDSETSAGTCVAMCSGSPAAPVCDDPELSCSIGNEGTVILCEPGCDPILQNCTGAGHACVLAASGGFFCQPLVNEIPAGGACKYTNVCAPGLFCLNAALQPGCEAGADLCCAEFCDVTDPTASGSCDVTASGSECVAWYAEGEETPGLEHVGFCGLPL